MKHNKHRSARHPEGLPTGRNEPLILLVDDNETVLTLLSSWLSAAGFESITASSGREAIDKFRQTAFSVVVLDLYLGDAPDGLCVLEAIKKENPDAAIIMMSGAANAEVREDAIRRGAYAFLVKPFEPVSLLHLIRAAGHEAAARNG